MSSNRSIEDTHGPLLDEHGKPGAHALGEEHMELTDQKPSDDDESIDASGRNPMQRALDTEPAAELERPVVPPEGSKQRELDGNRLEDESSDDVEDRFDGKRDEEREDERAQR